MRGAIASAVLVVFATAIGASCAGQSKNSGVTPGTGSRSPDMDQAPESPQLELKMDITTLWGEIREMRRDAGMSSEPLSALSSRMTKRQKVEELKICPEGLEPEPDQCTDKCSIRDNICDNAEAICRIADDLGSDPWADDKCKSGKASCKEATESCCNCATKAANADPANMWNTNPCSGPSVAEPSDRGTF